MLRLRSDSTCPTVSAGHPGETGDKGISRTEGPAVAQNGAIIADNDRRPGLGERAQQYSARLLVHTAAQFPTLVGRGHSSNSRVITAGPSGSSNGITRIRDWTTSSQPSSEEEEEKKFLL